MEVFGHRGSKHHGFSFHLHYGHCPDVSTNYQLQQTMIRMGAMAEKSPPPGLQDYQSDVHGPTTSQETQVDKTGSSEQTQGLLN